ARPSVVRRTRAGDPPAGRRLKEVRQAVRRGFAKPRLRRALLPRIEAAGRSCALPPGGMGATAMRAAEGAPIYPCRRLVRPLPTFESLSGELTTRKKLSGG